MLRHVSPAFVEDPVRLLRVARCAARMGFRVAEETLGLMREMVTGGEIDALVPERIFVELDRAPGEPRPRRFFEVLHACGALEVLFPELARLYGVPQPARYHPGIDTGVHILLVLEVVASLSADRRVRFAALVHDLGKGTTPREQWPSHRGHEERSVVALIHGLCHRYRVPNDYRDLAVLVARYHGHCHRAPWNCGPARYRRPSKASTPCDGPSASSSSYWRARPMRAAARGSRSGPIRRPRFSGVPSQRHAPWRSGCSWIGVSRARHWDARSNGYAEAITALERHE